MAHLHSDWTDHNLLLHTIMVSAYLKISFVHFQQICYKEFVYSPRVQNYKSDEEETPFCNALSAEK
jgi:hypothetical protein